MTLVVDTSDHIYDDFSRLLFLNTHREGSALTNELPQIDLGESLPPGDVAPRFGHQDDTALSNELKLVI
jgi:hypothetical protein